MIDIYSKDKIQIPMPWQPLFPDEMVQEAMKKSTQARLNPSASYFSYHRTHTAIYKESPRIRYQVAVPVEPETIGARWRTSLFRCSCPRGREHLPCLHEAALLWQVEKNSSTGVFTAEESPHDYVHRLNLLSSRERLIKEAEKQRVFDQTSFPALDFFKQRRERSGPLLYDIRSALSAYQTDAYSCAMAREILKEEQSYVFSAHEKQEKDGSRSLSVNLNLIDPVENCRFTAASAVLSADHLTLTARAGFRNASGSTLQSVEDELHALALSYEGATKDEAHPLHEKRSFPELEDSFPYSLPTVQSSSSSEDASFQETQEAFLNINGLVLCHLLWDYLDEHREMVDFTDRNANLFFKEMDKASQIETQKTSLPEEVRPKTVLLTPRIIIEEGEAKLSFKIAEGAARAYIVRNLQNLADAYRRKQSLALSKTSSIDFSRNDFTEESALLYDFIGRRVGEVMDANERIERKNYYSYVRTLSVTSSMDLKGALLDNFYDAWEGKNCEYSDKTNQIKDSSIPVGHRAFRLSLETERVQDAKGVFAGVRVRGLIPVLLSGSGSHRYILNADGLSRVTEEELSAMAPFHSVADASGSFRFQVGLAHLQEFYYRVVPGFLQNPDIDFHDDCEKEAAGHLPPEPVFDFYLDCLDLNEVKDKHLQKMEQQERMKRKNATQKPDQCVLLRADVRYEDLRYSICPASSQQEEPPRVSRVQDTQADTAAYRDTTQENRILSVIQRYFPAWLSEKQSFTTFFTDEEMFAFLQSGISLLENYGNVHGTDAFRRHHIRKVTPVKVGISVDSNIVNLEFTSGELSPDELLKVMDSYQKKKRFYKLSSGDYLDLTDADSLSQADLLMNALDLSPESVIAHGAKVPLYRALYLDKLLEEHEALASSRDRIYRSLIRNFHTIGEAEAEPPKTLENTLRPYQSYGFKWIKTLEGAGFGGILADEMGLGKTLQMISVLSSSYLDIASSAATPAVTATLSDPATLTTPAAPITGGASAFQNTKKRERADLLSESTTSPLPPSLIVCPASLVYNWQEEFHKFAKELQVTPIAGGASSFQKLEARWNEAQIYIISYDLLKRNLARLNDKTFFYVILDEAQYIKNAGAAAAKSVKTLKAAHRFALTGTPIENRLSEMWSIFDFLMPGFLYGRKEFEKKWEVPITKSHDADASNQLRKMTSPFILRRKKEEVLKDLPAKLEEVRYVQIEGEQQKLYDAQVLRLKNALGEWEIPGQKMRVFAELTRIRQICCDPSLLFENYLGESAKRQALKGLIRQALDGGHRILLFSQFTSMLALLEQDLKEEGISYYLLTGSTPKEKRIQMVHAFNEGAVPIFLISLKAGGTGLNLTGADVVIHYDPWWNVAAQNQATDRAHRIGQTRQVTVYRLIIKDTIEERILELQNTKRDLAESILEGDSTSLSSLSHEELLELIGG